MVVFFKKKKRTTDRTFKNKTAGRRTLSSADLVKGDHPISEEQLPNLKKWHLK